jgi:hypothetical protein
MRYCFVRMILCSSPIFTFLKIALLLTLAAQDINCQVIFGLFKDVFSTVQVRI